MLRRRLDYGRQKFANLVKEGRAGLNQEELADVDSLLEVLIRSTTFGNANIVRMLACVSNGDMRHALDMFREFVSSGNTNVVKIIKIGREYRVPFHEFAKSAILGSRKYYRSSVSHVVNVFKPSGARRASHLTALRILARLSRAEEASSPHGEGFVKVKSLLREYRESFGIAEDFQEWTNELLMRGLVESEPPALKVSTGLRHSESRRRVHTIRDTSLALLRIWIWYSSTRLWRIRELAHQLARLADEGDMAIRFQRVRLFMNYLANKENEELLEAARRSGPYKDSLMREIAEQIEEEIKLISKKLDLKGEVAA